MNYTHFLLSNEQTIWLDSVLEEFDLCAVTIHGSHLYGLNREGSDIDIKAVYYPSLYNIMLNRDTKVINRKNEDLDIEIEIKPITSFLQSAAKCDTNVIDMLHAPKEMLVYSDDVWFEMAKKRRCLYAKNMKGLIGYIKTQVAKYSHKIQRYNEMKALLTFCEESPYKTICDAATAYVTNDRKLKFISIVSDEDNTYIEVCGKKYIFQNKIDILTEALIEQINAYGKRTQSGADKGLDGKSLSHALRVLIEVDQILTEGTVTFPIKDKELLLDIKQDKMEVQEVISLLDTYYDVVMRRLEDSALPDEVDITPLVSIVLEDYVSY